MSEILNDLSDAFIVVIGAWTLMRYARGWRLEWRQPTRAAGGVDR